MAIMTKRWYRSRRNQIIIFITTLICIVYYLNSGPQREADIDLTRRETIIQYIENRLQETLKLDKGTGCEIPILDPFAKEVTQFEQNLPRVVCRGKDWVKCHLSRCRVVQEILDTSKDIVCGYKDIQYESDKKYSVLPPTFVRGNQSYVLTRSDHVKISCSAIHADSILPLKWTGYSLGFRSTVKPKKPPPGREKSYNVLILGFDSTAKNGFIRRMPHSYKFLVEELKATVLNGYNIVGDGTPAALFPILTGKTELELPDVRKSKNNNETLDQMPFIFYKLKEDGYRTAYFEDMPWIGTFQYRFNGFQRQPADHYLRAFFLEEASRFGKYKPKKKEEKYCIGDTPQYKLMMNITDQFFKLDGKKYCFTFIADITHDNFNMIGTADLDLVSFLTKFKDAGHLEDTFVMVMGDHGARYAKVRDTLQGKLEERLPLMALRLPDALVRERPMLKSVLQYNAEILTTPHDIYATVLDVIGLRQYWNPYKIEGADFTRGLTLLETVPKNRSCSEAGIEPHWCACLAWRNVSMDDKLYQKSAEALVDFLNEYTETVRNLCVPRTLTSIEWVMRQQPNKRLLSFAAAKDVDGYVGKFGAKTKIAKENYQVKIVVGPGRGVYEASLSYIINEDRFIINSRDISRTNAYNDEPKCISKTHPHLNMYCFCNG